MTNPILSDWKNKLYFGDNLPIMREHIPDESVDLIYLDPPFNSNATYNVLFREHDSSESAAQIQAFDDTWHWSTDAEWHFQQTVTTGPPKLADMLQAMRTFLGQNDMFSITPRGRSDQGAMQVCVAPLYAYNALGSEHDNCKDSFTG